MFVRSVIFEQLDADGTLKTVTMSGDDRLIIALAGDYDEPRSGAFHFLSDEDESRFANTLEKTRGRRVGANQFRRRDHRFEFETEWHSVPARDEAYYALSLPELGIIKSLFVRVPGTSRQYPRTVLRDDLKNRFVVYVRCLPLMHDAFSFELETSFIIDGSAGHQVFSAAEYDDEFCRSDEAASYYQKILAQEKGAARYVFGDSYYIATADVVAPHSTFGKPGLK